MSSNLKVRHGVVSLVVGVACATAVAGCQGAAVDSGGEHTPVSATASSVVASSSATQSSSAVSSTPDRPQAAQESTGAQDPVPPGTDVSGYGTSAQLVTTNAGSALGVQTRAAAISSRIWPAVFVPGPSGQFVPNRDLASAEATAGIPAGDTDPHAPDGVVVYTINPKAVYSDGAPVVCDDFRLTWRAATMRSIFESWMPLFEQVSTVTCSPDQRTVTVTFRHGFGSRWHLLFGPGQVLPSHAIARAAGVDPTALSSALTSGDKGSLAPVAKVWNTGFSLTKFNPELQVSSGPYKVASVDPRVSVTLVANPRYDGDAPGLGVVRVYPLGGLPDGQGFVTGSAHPLPGDVVDGQAASPTTTTTTASTTVTSSPEATAAAPVAAGAVTRDVVRVADVTDMSDARFASIPSSKDRFDIRPHAGKLTEQLVLADGGVMADKEKRRAFAACIDRAKVADVASTASGITVPPVGLRLSSAGDAAEQRNTDIAEQHSHGDMGLAKKILGGTTIRIGYLGDNRRYALMVDEIRRECAPAGITVTDASESAGSLTDLVPAGVDENDAPSFGHGSLDAVLVALDPESTFGSVDAPADNPQALRGDEEKLWENMPTIPLNAQPRVFVVDRAIANVQDNTGESGGSWNMDRWAHK